MAASTTSVVGFKSNKPLHPLLLRLGSGRTELHRGDPLIRNFPPPAPLVAGPPRFRDSRMGSILCTVIKTPATTATSNPLPPSPGRSLPHPIVATVSQATCHPQGVQRVRPSPLEVSPTPLHNIDPLLEASMEKLPLETPWHPLPPPRYLTNAAPMCTPGGRPPPQSSTAPPHPLSWKWMWLGRQTLPSGAVTASVATILYTLMEVSTPTYNLAMCYLFVSLHQMTMIYRPSRFLGASQARSLPPRHLPTHAQ